MKILLTGANGYVGSYLISDLLSEGHSVTTLTRRPFFRDGTRNVVINSYSSALLSPHVEGQDVVIHLAGLAHSSGNKEALNSLYMQVNVNQSLALAQEAKAAGVKRFVFISSIKVNGEVTFAGSPFRADMTPSPEDAYGKSKWAAEQALKSLFEGSQTELVIVRPPLVWGGRDVKGNLLLLRKLAAWGIPLPIGSLTNRRDLVSLENLSSFICVLVHHPRARGQTFLVSDGVARNLAQIVALIVNQGTRPRILRCPEWFVVRLARLLGMEKRLTGNLEVDISPSYKLLGWLPNKQGLPDIKT